MQELLKGINELFTREKAHSIDFLLALGRCQQFNCVGSSAKHLKGWSRVTDFSLSLDYEHLYSGRWRADTTSGDELCQCQSSGQAQSLGQQVKSTLFAKAPPTVLDPARFPQLTKTMPSLAASRQACHHVG